MKNTYLFQFISLDGSLVKYLVTSLNDLKESLNASGQDAAFHAIVDRGFFVKKDMNDVFDFMKEVALKFAPAARGFTLISAQSETPPRWFQGKYEAMFFIEKNS
jgi:hypothetical protein